LSIGAYLGQSRLQEFSYNINDLARYYRNYLEIMRHWNEGHWNVAADSYAR
jgi:hypothetical protein